jgi:hypothetical protein
MDAADLIERDGSVGVRVGTAAGSWEVTFATRGDLAGHVKLTEAGAVVVDANLATGVQPQVGILARAE